MKGWRWGLGASGYSMFNCIQTPNDQPVPDRRLSENFQVGGAPWPDASFSIGAASNHPGGCNVLFADGSARFVKDSINRMTWWGLGTKGEWRGHQLRRLLEHRLKIAGFSEFQKSWGPGSSRVWTPTDEDRSFGTYRSAC